MRTPRSMWSPETFGRVRLGRHFYMRDFLYSEIGRIAIRSGYRRPALNRYDNEKALNCARNDASCGHHIWDRRRTSRSFDAMDLIF